MVRRKNPSAMRIRYGIGEWYGKSFTALTLEERSIFSNVRSPKSQLCIPRSTEDNPVPCVKRGGVCSLRLYQSDSNTNRVEASSGPEAFCTLCPHRFKESGVIFEWVGNEILGHPQPLIVTEVGFLIREHSDKLSDETSEDLHAHEEGRTSQD